MARLRTRFLIIRRTRTGTRTRLGPLDVLGGSGRGPAVRREGARPYEFLSDVREFQASTSAATRDVDSKKASLSESSEMRSRSQLSKSKVSIRSARVPSPEIEVKRGGGDRLGRVDVKRWKTPLLLDEPGRRLVGRTSVNDTTALGKGAEVVELLEDLRPWLVNRCCRE